MVDLKKYRTGDTRLSSLEGLILRIHPPFTSLQTQPHRHRDHFLDTWRFQNVQSPAFETATRVRSARRLSEVEMGVMSRGDACKPQCPTEAPVRRRSWSRTVCTKGFLSSKGSPLGFQAPPRHSTCGIIHIYIYNISIHKKIYIYTHQHPTGAH